MIYPIRTQPVFKQYIWGGDNLKKKYNKDVPFDTAAESWEISCHNDGLSIVAEGEYKGKTLKEVIFSNKKEMLGYEDTEVFPLLVKILDAKDSLSVQVHPDNEFAAKYENGELGKTEMWYIIDAKPDANLVFGLKEGTTPEILKKAIEDGTLEEHLNYVPVKKGDYLYIPSGTIHAIRDGILIAEIQQSSNTTYRVYDYNRVDKDGNKRPLHVEKAVLATNYENTGKIPPDFSYTELPGGKYKILTSCEYFTVEKYEINSFVEIKKETNKFEMLIFTDGTGKIIYDGKEYKFLPGDSFFIPAAIDEYRISGKCEFLRSFE